MVDLSPPINLEEAEFIVRKLMKDNRYKVGRVFSLHFRNGLTATHEKLIIPVKYENTKNPIMNVLAYIKKTPKERPHMAKFSIGEKVFDKEVRFYDSILPCLLYKYRQRPFTPNCALMTDGRLVFENLTEHGYEKRELYDSFPLLKNAFISLARFHCCTFVAESLLTIRFEKTTTMQSRFDACFNEMMFNNEHSTIGKFYRMGIELTCILAEKLFQHNAEELRTFLRRADHLIKISEKHRNVVCHGDLRKENIRFFIKDVNHIKCVFLNFYMIRYAPLALDLLQLLYLHTSKRFRTNREEEILKIYQSKLLDTVVFFENLPEQARLNIPSWEDIQGAIQDLRMFGPAVACVYTSLSLMDETSVVQFIRQPAPASTFLTEKIINSITNKLIANEKLKKHFGELLSETI